MVGPIYGEGDPPRKTNHVGLVLGTFSTSQIERSKARQKSFYCQFTGVLFNLEDYVSISQIGALGGVK